MQRARLVSYAFLYTTHFLSVCKSATFGRVKEKNTEELNPSEFPKPIEATGIRPFWIFQKLKKIKFYCLKNIFHALLDLHKKQCSHHLSSTVVYKKMKVILCTINTNGCHDSHGESMNLCSS